MKNSVQKTTSRLKKTNIVYQIGCPYGDYTLRGNGTYVGMTKTFLCKRLTLHLQKGAPNENINEPPTRSNPRRINYQHENRQGSNREKGVSDLRSPTRTKNGQNSTATQKGDHHTGAVLRRKQRVK